MTIWFTVQLDDRPGALAQVAQASDITTSNVPGPPVPMYLAGARMVAAYPLVATIGAAVNITMVTYDGRAFVGLSADDRAVADLDALVEDVRQGFALVTGAPVGLADPYAEGERPPDLGEESSGAADTPASEEEPVEH